MFNDKRVDRDVATRVLLEGRTVRGAKASTVVLNGAQLGGSPNLALNSILMVLVLLNVDQ